MKTLHVSDHLPGYHRNWGGAEQVAYRYMKLLSDTGEVSLSVAATRPIKDVDEFRFYRVRTIEDFFPTKFHVFITGIKNRIFSFDPLSFLNFLMVLLKEKPQIVHFHKFNKISFSAILAAKIAGAKTIMGIYDYWYFCPATALVDQKGQICERFHGPWCKDCDAVTDFRFLLPLISPIRRPIFDFFYRRIDAFAVLSEDQGKLLEDYGIPKKKIFLVRQVFDFSKIKPSRGLEKRKTILFSGWMDPRKGLHVIIEAMPEILRSFPATVLQVFELPGIQGYKEDVLRKIKDLGLGKNIEFYKKLPWEEFNKFLAKATVVVIPEQWANMSPALVVEGMANGKVVVASNVGGIPEFINNGKNGLLADRTNHNDFARKIIWALKNPGKAKVMGERAAQDIVKLCEKKDVLKNLLILYQNV
jgi:glycosyltransferase involved in cell wall biosynthesis